MQWMTPVFVAVAVAAALIALMGVGWRHRIRRQSEFGTPEEAPADPGDALFEAQGQYVCTTTAGDWLDRIAVHGLGIRSNAVVSIHREGVLFTRTGAPDVYIPRAALTGARLERGMAGKFVEKDGLVVLTWLMAGQPVDTGFRTRRAVDKTHLLTAVTALVTTSSTHDVEGKDIQ